MKESYCRIPTHDRFLTKPQPATTDCGGQRSFEISDNKNSVPALTDGPTSIYKRGYSDLEDPHRYCVSSLSRLLMNK